MSSFIELLKNLLKAISLRDIGGAMRDRTADLLDANQALSQLSYGPMFLKTLD
jgi:hypothetical protein